MAKRQLCDYDFANTLLNICQTRFTHAARILGGTPIGECSWGAMPDGTQIIAGSANIESPRPVYLSLGQTNESASQFIDLAYGNSYMENAKKFMRSIGKDIDETSTSTNPGWLFSNTCKRIKFFCNNNEILRHAIERELLNTSVSIFPLHCSFGAFLTPENNLALLLNIAINGQTVTLLKQIITLDDCLSAIDPFFSQAFPGCSFKYVNLDNENWLLQDNAEREARWKVLSEELTKLGEDQEEFNFQTEWGNEALKKYLSITTNFYKDCIARYGLKGNINQQALEFSINNGDTDILDKEAARSAGELPTVISRTRQRLKNAFLQSLIEYVKDKLPPNEVDRDIKVINMLANGIHVGQVSPNVKKVMAMFNKVEYPIVILQPNCIVKNGNISIRFKKELRGKVVPESEKTNRNEFSSTIVDSPKSARDFIGGYMDTLKKLVNKIDIYNLA